ncbi:hypothetical protein NC652_040889 [Populus alba x Populus x berolinensis]|nr:hypothetical protein NC652_040889 [Populus alba x Populus x berolinensis]
MRVKHHVDPVRLEIGSEAFKKAIIRVMHPSHLFPSVHIKNHFKRERKERKKATMSGIMHKIEETLHIGGKKEEQKSGKPDEHKGEHKGESHGEHKPEHSGNKEGFLEKIHGDGHGEGEKKKKEKKEKKKKEKKHGHDGHSSSDSDSD